MNSRFLSYLIGTSLCVPLIACNTATVIPKPATTESASLETVIPEIANKLQNPANGKEADNLLTYFQKMRLTSTLDLSRSLTVLAGLTKTPYREIQRAMMLSLLRGSGDLMRAQISLDSVIKSNEISSENLKPIASMLLTHVAELRRLDEFIEKQSQQLKESQRRIEQLNQKLEDLKTMERLLPSRVRSPAVSNTEAVLSGGEIKP
jgi:hypothetical protein